MKSSQVLISSLLKQLPNSDRIQQTQKLQKIKIILPKTIKDSILSIYLKDRQLFFAFNNPIICNEFNKYHTKNILQFLTQYQDFLSFLPQNLLIKGYVPLNRLKKYQTIKIVNFSCFKERSRGKFKNYCHFPPLRDKFEEMRNIILENQC